MKKLIEKVKFPNSVRLFQFCRHILDEKFESVRVIDQDIGKILGFDPADCSHWKKGKKNIRSIQAIQSIAKSLGVDQKLVVDIALGEVDEDEAMYEYRGYGDFSIDHRIIEDAKKGYYRKNISTWSHGKETEFKSHFQIDIEKIDESIRTIHENIHLKEAPLYLPEIAVSYPQIQFLPIEKSDPAQGDLKGHPYEISIERRNNLLIISYLSGSEIKPFMRFQIARSMAEYFIGKRTKEKNSFLKEYIDVVDHVEANLFAAKLLTPAYMIRKEMKRLDPAQDIVTQMSEVFWVSKMFMNKRLKYIIENHPDV